MFPVTSGIHGGVQSVVQTLIGHLCKQDAPVRLYDYKNGMIRKELERHMVRGYEFIALDEFSKKLPNLGNEVFILTNDLFLKYSTNLKIKDNVFILVWDVFYPMLETLGNVSKLNLPFLRKKIISDLVENNAIAFLDQYSRSKVKKCDSATLVRVPVVCEKNYYKPRVTMQEIVFGYIGRAVDWKVYPLKKLISDLSMINGNFKVLIFTNSEKEFDKKLVDKGNVAIEYKVGISGKELKSTLLNEIHIGYSMGAAALEFASIGIPVLQADFDHKDFPSNYKYRFIYDPINISLGMDIKALEESGISNTGTPLSTIITNLDLINSSNRSFSFCIKKHSVEVVSKNLLIAAKGTKLKASVLHSGVYKFYGFHYRIKKMLNKNPLFYGWSVK